GLYVRVDLRELQAYCAVDIPDFVTFGTKECHYFFQQLFAIDTLILRIRIREVVANVTQIGCSKKCFTNYMDQHVGIRVPNGSLSTRNLYASKPIIIPLGQLVHIVTKS